MADRQTALRAWIYRTAIIKTIPFLVFLSASQRFRERPQPRYRGVGNLKENRSAPTMWMGPIMPERVHMTIMKCKVGTAIRRG